VLSTQEWRIGAHDFLIKRQKRAISSLYLKTERRRASLLTQRVEIYMHPGPVVRTSVEFSREKKNESRKVRLKGLGVLKFLAFVVSSPNIKH
jgi:hypothetical protein